MLRVCLYTRVTKGCNKEEHTFFCVATVGIPKYLITLTVKQTKAFARLDSFLPDLDSNEHPAVAQLNLRDVQEKWFLVSWPVCLTLARNLLVWCQHTGRRFSTSKMTDLHFVFMWAFRLGPGVEACRGGDAAKSRFNQDLITQLKLNLENMHECISMKCVFEANHLFIAFRISLLSLFDSRAQTSLVSWGEINVKVNWRNM